MVRNNAAVWSRETWMMQQRHMLWTHLSRLRFHCVWSSHKTAAVVIKEYLDDARICCVCKLITL